MQIWYVSKQNHLWWVKTTSINKTEIEDWTYTTRGGFKYKLQKNRWVKIGINNSTLARKWKEAGFRPYKDKEVAIIKSLNKANISVDKCDKYSQVIDKYYDKLSSCKKTYLQIIEIVNKYGMVSSEEFKMILNGNQKNKRINQKNKYWANIGVDNIKEIKSWQKLNFKMTNSMYRREDGKIIKKLIVAGLNAR